jgi:hypothetical protein
MHTLIAHAVVVSLALFTVADGPSDRPGAGSPATGTAMRPDKVGPASPASATAKVSTPAKPASPDTAAAPGRAADGGKVDGLDKKVSPARLKDGGASPAPVKAGDEKPCEPVKPCSID